MPEAAKPTAGPANTSSSAEESTSSADEETTPTQTPPHLAPPQGDPLQKPAATPPPVILDGAAAAWTAIPTSPRGETPNLPENKARPAGRSFVWAGLAVVILVGLFVLWRMFSTAPAASLPRETSTPSISAPTATHAPDSAATQAALALVQTQNAQPPTLAPTLAPTLTLPPAEVITPTATAPAISDLRLAFVSYRSGSARLTLMNPDRPTEWVDVILPADYETSGTGSFCGGQIVFEAEDRQLNLPRWVFFYDLQTEQVTQLTLPDPQPERTSSPNCSPSGRYLVFNATRQGRRFLTVLDRTENKIIFEQLGAGYLQMGMVSWPSAEDRFLWQGMRGEQAAYDINLTSNLGLDKSIRTQRVALDGKFPALSPDGSRIAYFCGNFSRLCMVSWPSNKLEFELPISYFKMIDNKPVNATAAWASDGAWVYFSSSITGNWDIYRMRPDGSQMQNLTESSTADEILPTAR